MDLVYSHLLSAMRHADPRTGEAGNPAVVVGACLAGIVLSLLLIDPAGSEAFAAWAMSAG
jgi:hypothetical protein